MDWSEPATAVMSHGAAAVLRALAGVDGHFSVRELGRLAEISPSRARQAVERLAEHGVVTVETSPGSHIVRLNRDHLATEPSIALATLRGRVLDRLRSEFASWSRPAQHVSLFGSAARGDGSARSDIDVLVVHSRFLSLDEQETWDDQLARSGENIQRWTGNWVGWFQVSEQGLSQLVRAKEPIVAEWLREALTLTGPALSTVLGRSDGSS